ncbi:unnamed protein product [Didymodactylos carnosus]|uniref:Uncharacterized protein n=2 Tax=Didymodactylos carnosus TaxID=1234261 RepID=A0A8S2EI07_9BILA|nr:unnamed protein product [Didymodactylos carnosus]CAF4039436.1 unnamed protein product [Didymodactylos carnosus]
MQLTTMYFLIIISFCLSTSSVDSQVPVAANLDGLDDWSRSLPYVDLIRQARVWGSPAKPWDANATTDPITGWPTSDFGVVLATNAVDMGGIYLLTAQGNAVVTVAGGSSAGRIANKTYDPSTNRLTAFVVIPQGASQIMLSFVNTSGHGVQNITLLQPNYDLTSQSNITNLMLTHLSRFSIIRFMDWMATNNNPDVNWNDSTPLWWPQYTTPKHNPWDTIPYIVNKFITPVDIWINIPFGATDDYVLQVAQLMLNQLNPSINIYVEYSNEVWNYIFTQASANLRDANVSVLNQGDPLHLAYDNNTNVGYWAFRRTASQIKRISDLFKTVFGQQNVGPWKRIRPILAGQSTNPIVITQGLDYISNVYGPPSNYLHGIAIAPYFDLAQYKTWSNLTTDQVIDGLNSSIQTYLPEQGWSVTGPIGVHGTYAAWYGLAVHGYEGGPDTASGCGSCSLQAKINATRDGRMTNLCTQFLNGWYRYGFQPLNWFVAGAIQTTQSGSWGLLEDMRQETLINTTGMFNSSSPVALLPRPSPKLAAIDQIRLTSSIPLTFGIPIPSYNVNSTNFMNHRVPYTDPWLRNLGPNSTFYYPLQILQSPMTINVTVYVAGNSGTLEASINNADFIQVRTPSTGNYTNFQPAPIFQFTITKTVIPSIVTLRLKNIINGYSILGFDVTSWSPTTTTTVASTS